MTTAIIEDALEHLETSLVHLARPKKGPVNPPVSATSTVVFPTYQDMQEESNYRLAYGRHGTDIRFDLEDYLAKIQGTEKALLCPSGVSATSLALKSVCNPGDHLLVADNVYGNTRDYCEEVLKPLGVKVEYFDPTIKKGDFQQLLQENTAAVYLESPGSNTFEVSDVEGIADAAHKHGERKGKQVSVLADATWATPMADYLPKLGVDLIIHSLTKYPSGHSNLIMGAICGADDERMEHIHHLYKLDGLSVSPQDCGQMMLGMRTMAVRVAQQEKTALELAKWLEKRPEVDRVLHPALKSCPGHEHWKKQMKGKSSGLFSIVLKDKLTTEQLTDFLDDMKLFGMGYSWGGYESLILPSDPSHYRVATTWDEKEGTLLRIHAGLENVNDLKADLENAFERIKGHKAAQEKTGFAERVQQSVMSGNARG